MSKKMSLQELEIQLDKMIDEEMIVNEKSAAEIREARQTETFEVRRTRERVSSETLEKRFEAEYRGQRIVFPIRLDEEI